MASPDIAPQLRPRPGAEFIYELHCGSGAASPRPHSGEHGICHLLGDRRSQPTPMIGSKCGRPVTTSRPVRRFLQRWPVETRAAGGSGSCSSNAAIRARARYPLPKAARYRKRATVGLPCRVTLASSPVRNFWRREAASKDSSRTLPAAPWNILRGTLAEKAPQNVMMQRSRFPSKGSMLFRADTYGRDGWRGWFTGRFSAKHPNNIFGRRHAIRYMASSVKAALCRVISTFLSADQRFPGFGGSSSRT